MNLICAVKLKGLPQRSRAVRSDFARRWKRSPKDPQNDQIWTKMVTKFGWNCANLCNFFPNWPNFNNFCRNWPILNYFCPNLRNLFKLSKLGQFVSKFGQSAQIVQIWIICVQILAICEQILAICVQIGQSVSNYWQSVSKCGQSVSKCEKSVHKVGQPVHKFGQPVQFLFKLVSIFVPKFVRQTIAQQFREQNNFVHPNFAPSLR